MVSRMRQTFKYYIGIDGGGTKTAVCAANTGNTLLRYSETGASSWREDGASNVAKNLREAVNDLIGDDYNRIAGIVMGLPCYGESEEGDYALGLAIYEAFADIPICFTNDVEVGWAGSMALEPGINIVAGTGSIAFGKDIHGKIARSGGWSEFFGDEGSCYWIGRKVMELFSKQSDGRMPKDGLYTTVCQEFKLQNDFSFIDLVHNEYAGYRKQVAGLQLLAKKAALAGSPSARILYEEAVDELLLLVTSVRDKLDFNDRRLVVSYSGGLFKAGDLVLPDFSRKIEKEGGSLSAPRFKPVEGALLLAFQHYAPDSLEWIQKILMESKA